MGKIYIIGLGPGSIDDLSLGAVEKIRDGNKNFLRTEHHPTVEYFKENKINYESFDYMYEEEEDFERLYENIADQLISLAEEEDINYFVPGNPMVAEKTVEILLTKKEECQIISGMSFIEPVLELVGRDPINGLKIVDGSVFSSLMIDINVDIIITQVYNKRIMSEIKLILGEIYGDEYELYLIHGAGIEGVEEIHKTPLYLLDRFDEIGYLTSIYLPRIEKDKKEIFDFNDLVGIMRTLRGEDGCPWDIKQDHKSLRQAAIEEAYELADAIDQDDIDNLVEELGDLLLQVIFHGQIGEDEGSFNLIDVTSGLANKLIYRHPHIFSEKKVENSQEVVYNWNQLKDSQRGNRSLAHKLASIPALPALMKSYKIQERAAEIGFDWDQIKYPMKKVLEEYGEVKELIDQGSDKSDRIEEEVGDLLLAVVNLSRFLGLNPELALNKSNNKFIKRLEFMEEKAKEKGKKLEDMSLEEMDQLWDLAKEEGI